MVTYLGAFLTVSPGGLKTLWWTHTLALLVFLPLIPHTKHLHLVLSPLTVFLKRDGFSKIPPLSKADDVEDFGLVTGKDVTQLIALQAYSCVECGRCTEHCPASTTGKVLNPKEIILGQRSYLKEFGALSEVPLLNELRETLANASTDNPEANYFSMEAAFECTTCGACEFQCPVGIQHLPIIVGAAARRDQHRRVGRPVRDKAVPGAREERQRTGTAGERARQVHQGAAGGAAFSHLRRLAGVLPVAWVHGRVRPQGTGDYRRFCTRDDLPRDQLRRSEEGKMHGRSGTAVGERPGLRQFG